MRRGPAVFLILSGLASVLLYASFFVNLASTLSDWTAFGFSWPYQLFYNFLHGRPFQSSIFATRFAGESVGFLHNPHAYIHANVIHVNLTPYLFAYLWALHPTPAFLYALIFAWNIAAGGALSALILRRLDPAGWRPKALFAVCVLAGGGLLAIMAQMAQFLLFAGPLALAAHYGAIAKRPWLFALSAASLCLLSEDLCFVVAGYAAYLHLFEPERRRWARACGVAAAAYFLVLQSWIQPAARADLVLREATNLIGVVKHVLRLDPGALIVNLKSCLPAFALLPAFLIAGLWYGRPDRRRALRLGALALLPSLPHWGESLVVGGAHHLVPPYFYAYLALLQMSGEGHAGAAPRGRPARLGLVLACAAHLLLSLRVAAGNLPNGLKLPLYRLAGKNERAAALERGLRDGRASNEAVIAAARAIPVERSLSYLVNKPVSGFILDRCDLWQFPDYFERTDFLLVQKDAWDLTFLFDPAGAQTLGSALERGEMTGRRDAPMTPAMLQAIQGALLAGERTHRIAYEDEHVLVFERLRKEPFPVPAQTMGFGWLRRL